MTTESAGGAPDGLSAIRGSPAPLSIAFARPASGPRGIRTHGGD
jgi:hypothetical protein